MVTPTPGNANYHPLLPKTTQNFPGGNAPGQWNIADVPLFNRIGSSLDFDTGIYNEINSIPSPWSRALQFISAIRNDRYPSRQWLIEQYRGLLATIALSENLNLGLQAVRINLQDYQNNEFGRSLWKLLPNEDYNVLEGQSGQHPWAQLYLFTLEGHAIGFTSPATLIVPSGYLKPEVERRIPWIKNGFFTDPISNGLTSAYKSLLASWLQNLHSALLRNPVNRTLAGEIAAELDQFQQALGVTQLAVFEPSERPIPFGEPLAPPCLDAFKPAKMVKQESNVRVLCSTGFTPTKQLYLIDQNNLPAIMNRSAREINVIDATSLEHLPPNLLQRSDARFFTPADLFTENLYYTKVKGSLPGTWLDRKLNLDNLSILLPLNPILRDYFSSQDLEKNVQLEPCTTPEGPGVRVTLTLKLSGFNNQSVTYSTHKNFPLKAENEITLALPTLALWPNVPPGNWREYFLFVDVAEGYGGLAFNIEQPTEQAIQETSQSGQEKYRYWKCERYPEILSAIDNEARFLGLLPLSIPQTQAGNAGTWTVGVDFGTSFTNVYVRRGNSEPSRLNLRPNLLKITRGLEDIQAITYREFFIPDVLLPEGDNPPLSTMLTTRGWQEVEAKIPNIVSHARIYVPRLDKFSFDNEYIKTNVKWQNIQYQRPFLNQFLTLIAAQAAQDGVHTIEWGVSYPSAFSQGEQNRYEVTWQNLLQELSQKSGQTHRFLVNQPLRTESIAFAQFFGDILEQQLVHTTCVDIGGGTSDISIWSKNKLIHQASVPYAGRDLFHQILRPNLAYVGEIFGLSTADANAFRQELSIRNNFNSALDTYLRGNAEKILTNGYVMNADRPRSREFRTLVAFSLGGLFHYLGLIQKYLVEQGISTENEYVTSVLIGGNGSRFIHWLTTSGRYTSNAGINQLLGGILTQASGSRINPEEDLVKLSPQPKEEACGGLVVLPNGQKLTGWQEARKESIFAGEVCVINGQTFEPNQRFDLNRNWETIEEFRVESFNELERYLKNFNAVIADQQLEEIESLRHFGKGGLFTMSDDLRNLLQKSVTQACIHKAGPIAEFEPEPPFLLTLRCFIGILANQWSKAAS
ncbi:hypothetical protein [Synechocystis sp. LKSZ1]|uniref:hypothetical protein n=1 Tax=Synechocystis sp. LKSZ1 TaxID=3144951 RepID=UPI00336BEDA2